MKHDQEVYDKARGEMLTDMLDYIPARPDSRGFSR